MRKKTKTTQKVDIKVGGRVHECRVALGLSRMQLGAALGVSPQQIHKYEEGTDSLSASRLVALSEILGISISDLFADVKKSSSPEKGNSTAVKLVRNFMAIKSKPTQTMIVNLVQTLAGAQL